MKWFWAAYRKGGFEDIIVDGLDHDGFKEAVSQMVGTFNASYLMLARSEGESRPVGMIGAHDNGYRIEPHALWFPWATPRNKLESWLNFLNKIRVTRLAVIFVPEKEGAIYKHMELYGVIQQRGSISRFFEDGQSALIFQTKD